MCLHSLSTKKQRWQYGYKAFYKKLNSEIESYTFAKGCKGLPIGKELDERDYRPLGIALPHYSVGWHVFKYRHDAEKYIPSAEVLKVKMRNVRAYGLQGINILEDVPCAVAQYITILEKE